MTTRDPHEGLLDPRRSGHLSAIEALADVTLDVLVVLSGEDAAISLARWLDVLGASGVRIDGADLERHASRLLELQLVEQHRPAHAPVEWSVPLPVALDVLEEAHRRGRMLRLFPRRPPGYGFHFQRVDGSETTELRVALTCGDGHRARVAIDTAGRWRSDREIGSWLLDALGFRPPVHWLEVLADEHRTIYLAYLLAVARSALLPVDDALLQRAIVGEDNKLRLEAGRILAMRGDFEAATSLQRLPKWGQEGLAVLAAFWAGDCARAARIGDAAIAGMKSRKLKCLPDLEGICHILASLVACGDDPGRADAIGRVLDDSADSRRYDLAELIALHDVWATLVGEPVEQQARAGASAAPSLWTVALVGLLHDVWLRIPEREHEARLSPLELATRWSAAAKAGGYPPIAREFEALAGALRGEAATALAGSFRAAAPWETALAGLEAILDVDASPDAPPEELVWQVDLSGGSLAIVPRIRGARARKGRIVTLARLLDGKEDERLTEDDRRVLATVDVHENPWARRYEMGTRALLALVGHPRVIDDAGAPLDVEKGEPELVARQRDGLTRVDLEPADLLELPICVVAKPGSLVVYERTPALQRMTDLLRRGLAVPAQGRERLGRALMRAAANAGVRVTGELGVGIDDVAADARPALLLAWNGERLVARVRVAPLGLSGPHLLAGVGVPDLVAETDAQTIRRCVRDLEAERARQRELFDACPTLAGFSGSDARVCAPTLADALEIVLELDAYGDRVLLAWEAGRALTIPRQRDLDALHVNVSSGVDWLAIDARVDVDGDRMLDFRELLAGRAGSRFVAIGRERFLALSDRLRHRIDALADLGLAEADGVRASPVVLPVLEAWSADLEHASFDAATRDQLEALRRINERSPRLPRGFGATLREYQREGYAWLWRLAEARLGACLADDMGLGKTVQALALLVRRQGLGPALVVCPTSVVANWIAEAGRFAPGLRVLPLAEASDRAAALRDVGARDVVVCSYAIATLQIDALEAVTFATCVLDEAHALKNDNTQRTKAARRITADFRLGLTGTPVENRTTELWSLFSVLLPGLLGTKEHFHDRFAGPIESGHRERAPQLRDLLRPFVLRRTKEQVLDELPPRTDITLRIPPGPDERSFYEAVRRRALDRLAAAPPKRKRFLVLAEITKLRQAAVEPRIIDPDAPSGAKLDALARRLSDLREEGHRALVFTQFLGAMAAVRERLAQAGIEYFDLEGSTPPAERKRRIDAFQAGERDVFLLSLRAGGLGINLTGADYVFHLDPWWNPAVEDQATDRAHRMGQHRPVTVYRLVTEGTIEEKILALHEHKRELAEDLLEGLERAEQLDLDALVDLLRG